MASLSACLSGLSWHTLKAVVCAHGLPFHSRWTKAEIRGRLLDHLGRRGFVVSLAAGLPEPEQAVLTALIERGGGCARAELALGPIVPYRPWRRDSPRHPWRCPASPAERLYFLGLIYLLPDPAGQGEQVVLPDEFRDWLGFLSPPGPQLEPAEPPAGGPLSWPPAQLAVAVLLALCQRESIRPLHRRWLAPRWLKLWAAHLPLSLALDGVRSERAIPYLALLHYLAEAAGLLALQAGLLKPALAAWRWLDALSAAEQRQQLWQGWLDDLAGDQPRWRAYRLSPWDEIEPADLSRWLPFLAQTMPPGGWLRWLPIAQGLTLDPAGQLRWWSLVSGPLAWLGLVETAELGDGEPVLRWLPPPACETASRAAWRDATALHLPADLPAGHRFRLLQLTTHSDPKESRLTPASFRAARQAGWDRVGIERVLVDATGEPLPDEQRQLLNVWESEVRRLTLGWKVILSSTDRRLLAEVAGQRGIRVCLGQTLSANHLEVDPNRVDQLVRRLARQGLAPWLETPAAGQSPPLTAEAVLWLGLRVYQLLGRFVRLPLRPTAELLPALEGRLTAQELAAVQHAVRQIEAELQLLVDGYTPALPARASSQGDDHRQTIVAALAEGASLDLVYLDAGSGQETRRRVDPYRLEQRGALCYLVGYCHLRQADRLFRLDRILECRLILAV